MEPEFPRTEKFDEPAKALLIDLQRVDDGEKISAAELNQAEFLTVGVETVSLRIQAAAGDAIGLQPFD
jgi:hypothetical protein